MDELWVQLLGEEAHELGEADRWARYDVAAAAWQKDMKSPSPRVQLAAEKRQELMRAIAALRNGGSSPREVAPEPAFGPAESRREVPASSGSCADDAEAAVPAGSRSAPQAPPAVTGLVSRYAPPWVMLQWDWPGDAEAVRVCWTWDRHPLEPLEPGLCTDDVLRSRYEKDGCFKLRSDLRRPHFFGVFARPKVGEARFGPGAQVVEPTGTSIDIPYEVVVKKRFLRWGACQKVTVRLRRANSDEPEYLSGLSLIGRAGAVPVDLHGGSPVLEDCFAIFDEDGVAELEVAERFWNPKVFVRLFFREPPPTTSGARPIRLLPAAVDRLRLGA